MSHFLTEAGFDNHTVSGIAHTRQAYGMVKPLESRIRGQGGFVYGKRKDSLG